jgi:CubicO group peptidase (beta-lactamase class C family)
MLVFRQRLPLIHVPRLRVVAAVVLAMLFLGQAPSAQNPTFSLLERYVDALREQAGIPGLAATVIRDGRSEPDWEKGFGFANVEESVPVTPRTPFSIGELSQSVGAALALRYCVETGEIALDDQIRRWSPTYPEARATLADILSHTNNGSYSYSPERFSLGLTAAIEQCADRPYARLVFDEVIARFVMDSSAPGGDTARLNSPVRLIFPTPTLRQFEQVLRDTAIPYRLDATRKAARTAYLIPTLTAASGMVASVRDLAQFEWALDSGAIAVRRTLNDLAWQERGGRMGYGWFVQRVNGRRVVWQYGGQANAPYSSMMIKLPEQGLTFIMLANSDGLTAPFPLVNGDVTVSPFARIFFNLLG